MLPTYAHVVQMYPPFQNGLMTTPFYTYIPYYMHPPQYNPPQYMVNLPATTQFVRPVTFTHIKRKNKHDNNPVKRPKMDTLKSIGLRGNRKESRWNRMFHMLQAYCEEDGTDVNDFASAMKKCIQTKSVGTHIVADNQEDTTYKKLAGWCRRQRRAYKNEEAIKTTGKKKNMRRISPEHINKLESIGFEWGVKQADKWTKMFDMLQAYCEEDGTDVNDGRTAMNRCIQTKSVGTHIVAGNQEDTSYDKLGGWCIRQRLAYQNEKAIKANGKKKNTKRISSEQICKLESIGFAWDRNEHRWTKMFDMLRAYCQEDGTDVNDCRKVMEAFIQTKSVGTHIVADNQKNTTYKKLGIWCQTQRAAYRNEVAIKFYGKTKNTFHISKERIRKLESIGFKYRL